MKPAKKEEQNIVIPQGIEGILELEKLMNDSTKILSKISQEYIKNQEKIKKIDGN